MRAAKAALAQRHVVSAIDVLVGVRWLAPAALAQWRQGRVEDLETVVQVDVDKVSAAMENFQWWARDRGLLPTETAYLARTPDRRQLRFSRGGDNAIERAWRTHWVSLQPGAAPIRTPGCARRGGRP